MERLKLGTVRVLYDNAKFTTLEQGFGLVVRAAGKLAGEPDSILGRDGHCTFGYFDYAST
jgi:hypothetical protein